VVVSKVDGNYLFHIDGYVKCWWNTVWTTGKYRRRSVIHVLLRWITHFFPVFHGTLRNRRQKIFNKGLYVCAGGLDIQNFDKNSRFVVLVISIWGDLKFFLGGLSHKRPPPGDGNGTF